MYVFPCTFGFQNIKQYLSPFPGCCIYKKPVAFGESSSEDDEDCENCFGHPEKKRRNRKHHHDENGDDNHHHNDNEPCEHHDHETDD